MVIDAFAEGPALDPQEEGAALRPGEPQGLEGPVPLGLAPVRALHEDLLRDAGGPEATMRLAEQLVRGEERRDVPGYRRRDAADLPRDRVVHLLAPFHEKGRDVGRHEEQPVLPRERRRVRPQHSAAGCDPEEVRVHFRGEEGPGHQDARVDPVEHGPAEDARVQKPKGELPIRPGNDEPQDALVLIPPSHEEFRDLGKVGGDTAPDRVLPREGQALHERRVAAGLAPLPAEARLDDIQEFVLAGDPLRAQRGEESLHGFGDPDELVGHLPVDRPCLLRGLQQVHDREVADEMGADPVREVVRLVDDEDEILEGTSEPREESLADLAEHVVVVADDQPRFRRRVHGDPMRAHAARAARPDELLHVQGPLEDRGDDGGIVPREEPARPRLHLEVAEFLEGATVGWRPFLEAHGMLRDQVDRRDPRTLGFDPADGLDRDPMVTLPRRQEEDELLRGQGVVEGRDERHRGLPDPRRRVGEEMLPLGQGPPCVLEEIRLTITNPIEGPRHRAGRRTDIGPEFYAFHEGLEGPVSSRRRDMKRFPGEGRNYSGCWRSGIIEKERLSGREMVFPHGPPVFRLRVRISSRGLPTVQHDPAGGSGRLPDVRKGLRWMGGDLRCVRWIHRRGARRTERPGGREDAVVGPRDLRVEGEGTRREGLP